MREEKAAERLGYGLYAAFVLSFICKMYWFAAETNTSFFGMSPQEYAGRLLRGETAHLPSGMALVTLGTALCLAAGGLLFTLKRRLGWLIGVNLAASFIAFSDAVYFRYFEDLTSMLLIKQLGQAKDVGGSIHELVTLNDLFFFWDFFFLLPLAWWMRKASAPMRRVTLKGSVLAAFSLAAGAYLIYSPISAFIEDGGSYLFKKRLSNERVYNVTGLIGYHVYDIKEYAKSAWQKPSAQNAEAARVWFEEKKAAQGPLYGVAKGKNVIVVQLESLQRFVIGKSINGQEITPHLNRLKEESLYFPHMYDVSAQGRTSDAELMMNTSLHPLFAGSVYIQYPFNQYDALPAMLKKEGYETAAFHPFRAGFWNRNKIYKGFGYDHFYSQKDFQGEVIGWGVNDRDFFLQSVEKMTAFQQPFQATLIALTSHHPFDMPKTYQVLDTAGYNEKTFTDYLQSVHYVDKAVGEMVAALKKEGLWETSVVIFYGDHDNGLMKANSDMQRFTMSLDQPAEKKKIQEGIPLLIHVPGQSGKEVSAIGSQMDIAPTLLHVLGIPQAGRYLMGDSLLADKENRAVFRDGSFIDSSHVYLASQDMVFEKGRCYTYANHKETNTEACRAGYHESLDELTVSDDVINGNLLARFQKTPGEAKP